MIDQRIDIGPCVMLPRLSDAHAGGGGASASESGISHDKGCIFRWIKIS